MTLDSCQNFISPKKLKNEINEIIQNFAYMLILTRPWLRPLKYVRIFFFSQHDLSC